MKPKPRILVFLLVALAVALSSWPALAQADSPLDAEPNPAAVATSEDSELTTPKAVVLGLVEGLTEYLPVSSTGHLLVTNKVLNIGQTPESESAIETYAIAIQIGAIAAVVVLYWGRMMQMLNGLLGKDEEGRRILFAVAAAFAPTAVIALALQNVVEENLFGPTPIAIAWLVGGIGIIVFTKYRDAAKTSGNALSDLTLKHAAMIGLTQTLAIWPGTSRSLVTIVAGVLIGYSLAAAVEFSFLLGLVTLSAATVYSMRDGAELIDQFGILNPLIGLGVAFVAAIASIRFMVSWLETKSFDVFGYYRIVIGVLAFAAIGLGWL